MPKITPKQRKYWISLARKLAWITVFYNLAEAVACGIFGVSDGSLSLIGFGSDSLIEMASGMVVLWRFKDSTAGRSSDSHPEHQAHRVIGALLLLLAGVLATGAVVEFKAGKGPESGIPGIIISVISLAAMLGLFLVKRKTAEALKSPVLKADAFCTLSCMWLSGLLLAGSVLFTATHLALFDALATFGMAALIAKEGWENWEESECNCSV